MKALIAYASLSGNTEEVAELIEEEVSKQGFNADMFYIEPFGVDPTNISDYNIIFLGTYTWDLGATPDEVKDFVAEVGYKPDNIYVFGTGDTQFGGDVLFCDAARKLSKFYKSKSDPLKIEQSPRGSQEELITKWVIGCIQSSFRNGGKSING